MKEVIKMRTLLFITIILAFHQSFSQGGEGTTVIAIGTRVIEPAYRMTSSPVIIDTVIPTPAVEYPLLSLKYPTTTKVDTIHPANININPVLSQLYNGYIKAGVGTELMPLGELYWNSTRSRKYIYGVHVKHLSSFGNLPDYAPSTFDRTYSEIFGGINERKYTLRGAVHYNNQGLHYYAVSDSLNLHKDSTKQRYHNTGIDFSYASHKKDSAQLNYIVGLAYNNYLSAKPIQEEQRDWRTKENYFGITSGFWYRFGKEVFSVDANILYNGYKYGVEADTNQFALDSGIVLNNTIISIKPGILTLLKDNRFKAKIGADITFDIHNETHAHIYPVAELKYSLFNDIFIPYVGLRGGMKQTSFKSLTRLNEFLLPNVNMRNESTSIDFYGGIKGTLSRRIGFNAGFSFANVKDKALFITDTTYSVGNKFNVIFDTMNVTTIEGSVSYQLMEKIKVDAIGKFHSYSLLNNSYAWNLPQLEFTIRGSYNLYDKFLFNLDVVIEQGRKALVYSLEKGVTVENDQFIKDLKTFVDANLGLEYRYNKRISAFVQLNNIASQRYMRWYNAPVQSFQFMGGVTFRL